MSSSSQFTVCSLQDAPLGNCQLNSGFTLIEFIVVMVVVGILSAVVAMFVNAPIQSYLANSRRAALVDTADTALARVGRDLHAALPNSLRVVSASGTVGSCSGAEACYLEYLPILDGGRYRTTGTGNILDFTQADTSFDVIGPAVTVASGQSVVIYNLGLLGANAWAGDNLSAVNVASSSGCAGSGSACTLAFSSFKFPLESPSNGFFLVGAPVSYVCNPAAGTLSLVSGYARQTSQPTSFTGATSNLLASQVSSCVFSYQPGVSQNLGQLTMRLQLSQDGETVTLYREVVVNNGA